MCCALLFVLAAYLVCLAFSGYRAALRLRGAVISQRERVRRYQVSILWNVLSVSAVLIIAALSPMTLFDLGVRPSRLPEAGMEQVLGIGSLLIAGALALLFLYQMFAFLFSAPFRREQAAGLKRRRESGGWYDRVVDNLIPRTRIEKGWFAFSAIVAGIAEEIVFRGFALHLLTTVFPLFPPYMLAVAAGILFGLAHSYQGVRGAVKTALIGVLFGLLYLGTDSLLLCVLLHTLFDLSSAFLYEAADA